MGGASVAFGLVLALVFVAVAYAALLLLKTTPAQLTGYWAGPGGELFEIYRGAPPRAGEFLVRTASGFLGARLDEGYPLVVRGLRGVSVEFPRGPLAGRAALDRRRISWAAPAASRWHRQGL